MKNIKNALVLTILFYIVTGSLAATFIYVQSHPKKTAVAQTAPAVTEEAVTEEAAVEPEKEPEPVPAETTPEPAKPEEPAKSTPAPEPPVTETSPEVSETPVEEVHYYAFRTNHTQRNLNVRRSPSLTAKVIGRLAPGSTGYILEKGDEWCKIESGTFIGYSFSEYLDIYEITKEEFENR